MLRDKYLVLLEEKLPTSTYWPPLEEGKLVCSPHSPHPSLLLFRPPSPPCCLICTTTNPAGASVLPLRGNLPSGVHHRKLRPRLQIPTLAEVDNWQVWLGQVQPHLQVLHHTPCQLFWHDLCTRQEARNYVC